MALRHKLLLAFLLPLGLALGVSWAVHAALASSVATGGWVTHTLQVIAAVREQREVIQEAVAALRGYLISGDPRLLSEYDQARGRFGEVSQALLARVEDNPPQAERVRELIARFERWQKEVAELELRAVQGGQPVPPALLAQSQEELGRVREVSEALEAAEQALLQERLAASEAASRRAQWLAVAGPASALALALGMVLWLVLHAVRRIQRLAGVAQALGEGDLSRRAPVDGADEVGELAQTLNRMAGRLEGAQDTLRHNEAALRSSLRRLELLPRVSQTLIHSHDLDQMLQGLVADVAAALPADRVALMVMDLEERRVTHTVRAGPGAEQVVEVSFDELMQGLTGWALRELEPALSPKDQPDPRESPEVQRRRAETGCGSILVMPLHYQGRKLGTLTAINRPDQRDFDEQDVELLETVINQAVVAIENARLFESVNQSEALYRGMVSALSEGVVVQDAQGHIVAANAAAGALLGLTPGQMVGRSSREASWRTVREDGSPLPGEEHPSMVALRTGQPQQGVIMGVHRPDGALAWISVNAQPLFHPGEERPYAAVASFFDVTEIKQTREALAQQVASLEAERNFESRLNQLSSLLQACLNLDEAGEVIAHAAPGLFEGTSGAVFLLNPSRNLMEVLASWGGPAPEAFSPEGCWGLRRGQLHWVADSRKGLGCEHLEGAPPASYACQPLSAQGETLGLLYLGSPQPAEAPEREQQRVMLVSDQLALAIANLRLRETLRHQSIRDALTGLFNRRYLEETLQREIFRARRAQRPLSLLFFDVDHFKHFNDAHGHEAGDQVLQALGHLVRSRFRAEDVPCRYGGEEFVVILPDARLEDGRRRAEQLREAVKHIALSYQGKTLGPISLSVGVAAYPEHGDNPETLLAMADGALYQAKRLGRDRVAVAEWGEGEQA